MPRLDQDAARVLEFRRNALLYFLPLVVLNFLAGTKIMAANPGLLANEHLLGLVLAGLLSVAGLLLWRNVWRVAQVSYFMCACLVLFFLYREASLLYGPSSTNPQASVFMPLYGYFAILYFALYVFLPRRLALFACWGFWAASAVLVCSRLLPDWDYFSARHGAPDLLVYILIANPLFILLGRVMLQMQVVVTEAESDLAQSRREVELLAEVARSEQRFQRAVDGSRDGLWEWRQGGQPVLWLSPQVGSLLDLPASELPRDLEELYARMPEEDGGRLRQVFANSLDTGEAFEIECPLRTGDGSLRWFAIKGVPGTEAHGGARCVSGSLQSIHHRRLAEQAILDSNVALQQFAAVAAHDLVAPARKIGMRVDMVRRGLGDHAQAVEKHLASIQNVTDHMIELVDRMLRYASANAASEAAAVSLQQVLRDVVELLEREIERRDANIQVGELPEVWSNAGDLRQVFQNLVTNAMKFCEREPQIEIDAVADEHWVNVRVRDNGIGIDGRYLETIRKPLQRLHTAAEYEGFGLGLATVVRIVERNGGTLTIESTPGEGSVFIVRLPRNGPRQNGEDA